MTVAYYKLYLGIGLFIRGRGEQRVSEYIEIVPFQITHISLIYPTHLLENSCYGKLLGDRWCWSHSTDWDSSKSSSSISNISVLE